MNVRHHAALGSILLLFAVGCEVRHPANADLRRRVSDRSGKPASLRSAISDTQAELENELAKIRSSMSEKATAEDAERAFETHPRIVVLRRELETLEAELAKVEGRVAEIESPLDAVEQSPPPKNTEESTPKWKEYLDYSPDE